MWIDGKEGFFRTIGQPQQRVPRRSGGKGTLHHVCVYACCTPSSKGTNGTYKHSMIRQGITEIIVREDGERQREGQERE